STPDRYFFLALFLLAALLLVVRFTLAENMRQWRARGLRFSPDLSWDFTQAGALFSVVVLLLAYNLPVGTANADVLNAINSPQSPVIQVGFRLQQLFGGLVGRGGFGGVGFFSPSLRLVGTVDLPNVAILHYTLPSGSTDPTQYLITQTFDTYDGANTWSQSLTQETPYESNQLEPAPSPFSTVDTYQISFDRVPQLGEQYIFAPGTAPAQFSIPISAQISVTAKVPTTWQAQRPLGAGDKYTVRGYVSTASEANLRAVAPPSALTPQASAAQYPPDLLAEYLPSGDGYIAPDVRARALEWTKGATNMYDAALLIEDHLRTFIYSTKNPDPPKDQDAISWFLRQQQGFCTFFASAMALMGRSLGMPTRIASGFASGTYDGKANAFVVKGTAAHTWTQIYFGKYGWINFEPTQSFAKFGRSLNVGPTNQPTPTPGGASSVTPTPRGPHDAPADPNFTGTQPQNPAGTALVDVGLGLGAVMLLVLILMAFFLLWWRLLYRGFAPAAAAFARITRLGAWAGASPGPTQTPDEYAERLGTLLPHQRAAIEEVSAVYSRERWGGGTPREAAHSLAALYTQIRTATVPLIARRARRLPLALLRVARRRRRVATTREE
ncbi:MAG: transglutaminase domain-containing protein, partial [Ktedonobacterales bacterium]|nr:transglutaminase domain-containing protein [Ktedonobacterales bacterium]